jgi:AraC-like DNA-binding protein
MLVAIGKQNSFSLTSELFPKTLDEDVNYVLNTSSNEYYEKSHLAHLSIKFASSGSAVWETDSGRFEANTSGYLVLNPHQDYSVTVTSPTMASGTIIFLSSRLAADVHRSLTTETRQLLDHPEVSADRSLEFVERLYPHDNIVSPVMGRLARSITTHATSRCSFEDELHRLVEQLLVVQNRICRAEMMLLPATRPATRYELYRRIYRARDYIMASMDQPLTLHEMSRIACLSPNHFIRTFKHMFQMTPYRFLTEQRLKRAMELLADTELSITEITLMVGFESLGSFSWLFRRRLGISPLEFRMQNRKRKIVLTV